MQPINEQNMAALIYYTVSFSGHPNMGGPMQRMTPPRGMVPLGPQVYCLYIIVPFFSYIDWNYAILLSLLVAAICKDMPCHRITASIPVLVPGFSPWLIRPVSIMSSNNGQYILGNQGDGFF